MRLTVYLDGQEQGFTLDDSADAEQLKTELADAAGSGAGVVRLPTDRGQVVLSGAHIAAYRLDEGGHKPMVSFA